MTILELESSYFICINFLALSGRAKRSVPVLFVFLTGLRVYPWRGVSVEVIYSLILNIDSSVCVLLGLQVIVIILV